MVFVSPGCDICLLLFALSLLLEVAWLCCSLSPAVDKRIESEESEDEGKKQAVRLVTDLSQQSLRDEQNGESSPGTFPPRRWL